MLQSTKHIKTRARAFPICDARRGSIKLPAGRARTDCWRVLRAVLSTYTFDACYAFLLLDASSALLSAGAAYCCIHMLHFFGNEHEHMMMLHTVDTFGLETEITMQTFLDFRDGQTFMGHIRHVTGRLFHLP